MSIAVDTNILLRRPRRRAPYNGYRRFAGPPELFINVGRAGSDVAALAEALGRLVSLQLRLPPTMS